MSFTQTITCNVTYNSGVNGTYNAGVLGGNSWNNAAIPGAGGNATAITGFPGTANITAGVVIPATITVVITWPDNASGIGICSVSYPVGTLPFIKYGLSGFIIKADAPALTINSLLISVPQTVISGSYYHGVAYATFSGGVPPYTAQWYAFNGQGITGQQDNLIPAFGGVGAIGFSAINFLDVSPSTGHLWYLRVTDSLGTQVNSQQNYSVAPYNPNNYVPSYTIVIYPGVGGGGGQGGSFGGGNPSGGGNSGGGGGGGAGSGISAGYSINPPSTGPANVSIILPNGGIDYSVQNFGFLFPPTGNTTIDNTGSGNTYTLLNYQVLPQRDLRHYRSKR